MTTGTAAAAGGFAQDSGAFCRAQPADRRIAAAPLGVAAARAFQEITVWQEFTRPFLAKTAPGEAFGKNISFTGARTCVTMKPIKQVCALRGQAAAPRAFYAQGLAAGA